MKGRYLSAASGRLKKLTMPSFAAGVDYAADESVMSPAQAAESRNFDFSGGALKTGYGVESRAGLPEGGVTGMWTYRRLIGGTEDARLMYADTNGSVYWENGGAFERIGGIRLTGRPLAVNYKLYGEDVVLICSASDRMVVFNGTEARTVEDSPLITSMTLHYERLFVTTAERNAVWFSDDLDPTNWSAELDDGGFIELADERGRSNKVISYLNYVYVFRDYGISRLTAYADQSEFAVSNLFVSSGRIYAETAALCGDAVIFLADDGLYRFDGVSTSRILPRVCGAFYPDGGARAVYSGGKYYLAAATEPGGKIDGLLVLDVSNGKYAIGKGIPLRELAAVTRGSASAAVAILTDGRCGEVTRCGAVLGDPLEKIWRMPLTDLGAADKNKMIRDVYVDTKFDAAVTVRTERTEKKFSLKGSPAVQRVRVNLPAQKAAVEFSTRCREAEIGRPTMTFSLL